MTLYDMITLIAIVTGPVLAVLVSLIYSRYHKAYDRRLSVFRDLMQTRGIRLDRQHVSALNIVEVEFYNKPKIISAFKAYIDHLYEVAHGSRKHQEVFYVKRSELLIELLWEMGNCVGYKFDKMELNKRSYTPEGWAEDYWLQQNNARLLSEILNGQRPLPITNLHLNNGNNPFPLPPKS